MTQNKTWYNQLPEDRISQKAFDSLGEYSCSFPTGTRIGTVWKRNINAYAQPPAPPLWLICEYVDIGSEERVGIEYRKPLIVRA